MSDDNAAPVGVKAALGELATKAKQNPDGARSELQALIYAAIADGDDHAEKLGITADKLRALLGDANHHLALTGDAGTVIKNLLAEL